MSNVDWDDPVLKFQVKDLIYHNMLEFGLWMEENGEMIKGQRENYTVRMPRVREIYKELVGIIKQHEEVDNDSKNTST